MLTFVIRGGLAGGARVPRGGARSSRCAESLGGVESLIEHPAIMTHAVGAAGDARARSASPTASSASRSASRTSTTSSPTSSAGSRRRSGPDRPTRGLAAEPARLGGPLGGSPARLSAPPAAARGAATSTCGKRERDREARRGDRRRRSRRRSPSRPAARRPPRRPPRVERRRAPARGASPRARGGAPAPASAFASTPPRTPDRERAADGAEEERARRGDAAPVPGDARLDRDEERRVREPSPTP